MSSMSLPLPPASWGATYPMSTASGQPLDDAEKQMFFGEYSHADARFGEIKGALRWKHILRVYAKSPGARVFCLVKRYDANGGSSLRRVMQRDVKLNARRQDQVVKQYAKDLLATGALEAMRGQLCSVETTPTQFNKIHAADYIDPVAERAMLGGASFCEATEMAAILQPDNDYVKDIIEFGFTNVIVLMMETPLDVQRWIVEVHNMFHNGCEMNAIEIYELTPVAENSWRDHKKLQGITVASCPKSGDFRYEKLFEKHILTRFPVFKRWDLFDAWKSGYHKLVKLELWTEYKSLLEQRCEFMRKDLHPEVMSVVINEMLTAMLSFEDSTEMDTLKIAMWEALQFVVPLHSETAGSADELWIFKSQADLKRIRWIHAPMEGSVVYRKASKAKKLAESKSPAEGDAPPPHKKRRGLAVSRKSQRLRSLQKTLI